MSRSSSSGTAVAGADRWVTPNSAWEAIGQYVGSLFDAAKVLDKSAAGETIDFLSHYYDHLNIEGKRKRFPAVLSVYLSGLDHEAHADGMNKYPDFFRDMTDSLIGSMVKKLKEKEEFDNKIFVIVADHGHTAMPTNLKYKLPVKTYDLADNTIETIQEFNAEMSCKLKLDFGSMDEPDVKAMKAEQANNNLHIWELGEVLKTAAEESGLEYKVLAPAPIAGLFKDKSQNELPYGATAALEKANVIAALNGPMAHIYLRSGNNWKNIPSDDALNKLAIAIKRMLQESGINLDDDVKNSYLNLVSSVDKILIRQNGVYKIFNGYDATGSIIPPSDTSALPNAIYVTPVDRITGMNNLDRSGDLVLLFKDFTNDVAQNRYTSGVACKSWHGSLNPSDSYVPLIMAYPGGNKAELEPLVNNTQNCSIDLGCDGNWRVTDLIKSIVTKQY
jgi:hypothetical protein